MANPTVDAPDGRPFLNPAESSDDVSRSFRLGVFSAVLAHFCWGFFPLYWRLLGSVSSVALTSHRVVWSFLILAALTLSVRGFRERVWKRHSRPVLTIIAVAAVMIAINWIVFLYAVNSDQVLQASLGYYINPLVNVLLGVLVLKERLRRSQMVAVALAGIGVGVMSVAGGGVPWIAFVMALSFGCYGLMKKKATLGPLEGLTLETGMLFPVAAAYLVVTSGAENVAAYPGSEWALLVFGGALTILPLALFALAAQRVPLSTIGILQYIGPTLQWIVGAVVLGEPVGLSRFIGFAFVWFGVIVFMFGDRAVGWFRRRRVPSVVQ